MSTTINRQQGVSQSVKLKQGQITHQDKTATVGAVVKVASGHDFSAWDAAEGNGADDIQFRTDAGDLYIASGVGFEKLQLMKGNVVEFAGIKGRIVAIDNEANSKPEVFRHNLLGGVAGGVFVGIISGALLAAFRGGAAFGAGLGISTLVGAAASLLFGQPTINMDLVKLHGTEVAE